MVIFAKNGQSQYTNLNKLQSKHLTLKNFVRLEWQPKIGSSIKYNVQKVFETEFAKITHSFISTVTVKEISKEIVALRKENSKPEIKYEGPSGCPIRNDSPVSNYSYSTNGQYMHTEGESIQGMEARYGHLDALVFPDEAINIGDQWSHNIISNSKSGARAAKAIYKYIGLEKIAGRETIKISLIYQEIEGEPWERMSATGTKWISPLDGTLVRESINIDNAQVGVESIKMRLEFIRID